MVYIVVFAVATIACVNDTACVLMDVWVICRNNDGKRLTSKLALHRVWNRIRHRSIIIAFDSDVGGFGS